jgi:hypothetical protein
VGIFGPENVVDEERPLFLRIEGVKGASLSGEIQKRDTHQYIEISIMGALEGHGVYNEAAKKNGGNLFPPSSYSSNSSMVS